MGVAKFDSVSGRQHGCLHFSSEKQVFAVPRESGSGRRMEVTLHVALHLSPALSEQADPNACFPASDVTCIEGTYLDLNSLLVFVLLPQNISSLSSWQPTILRVTDQSGRKEMSGLRCKINQPLEYLSDAQRFHCSQFKSKTMTFQLWCRG